MSPAEESAVKAQQAHADQIYIPDHRHDIIPSQRHVRAQFGGQYIGDSKQPILGRESGHWLREYFFPRDDIRQDLLVRSKHSLESPTFGEATFWHIKVGDRMAENAVRSFHNPPPKAGSLKDYYVFDWEAIDAWFEEDDQIYRHARDPFKRIDVAHSSRHVQVIIAGETVADTHRPCLLFETGMVTRYYIPKEDVRMELLIPSDSHTQCPYKGIASYYSVKVNDQIYEDIAWYYPFPIPECPKIENLICFYNERVEAIIVDGEQQ